MISNIKNIKSLAEEQYKFCSKCNNLQIKSKVWIGDTEIINSYSEFIFDKLVKFETVRCYIHCSFGHLTWLDVTEEFLPHNY